MFKILGGLVGDVIEGVKYVGEGIIDAPGEFIDGAKEGLMTKEDEPKKEDVIVPKAPDKVDPMPYCRDEEIELWKAKLASLEAQEVPFGGQNNA